MAAEVVTVVRSALVEGSLMERGQVTELQYITALANIASILERGIVCHADAAGLDHVSVASRDVQARRAVRRIPGGLRLHQYANLYFNARNAMLFKIIRDYDVSRRVPPEELAILRISPSVLDLAGVVVTDINAAADIEPRWHTVGEGLRVLDHAEIHAERWRDRRHMQRMMAEVLVPRSISPVLIGGAYVISDEVATVMSQVAPTLATEVKPYMFFGGGGS
jgi:hypothetical protein